MLSVSGSTRGGLVRLSAYSGSEAEETQRHLRIQAGRHRGGRARGGVERWVEASAATGFGTSGGSRRLAVADRPTGGAGPW